METFVEHAFRFIMYVAFGLSMETLFSMQGIDWVLGCRVKRRVPRKYLEGFVSAYMVPLHGLGILFGFEAWRVLVADLHIGLRFAAYALFITGAEGLWGFVCDKTLGFYSWDYYADSKYKVFKRGYTLWTLVPLWGLAGLVLEVYTDLMIYLSPYVSKFFLLG